MSRTFYEILNVPIHASQEEIRTSYKELAVKYHPDKHPGDAFYEEHFKRISEAYQTLSDTEKRRRYDLKMLYAAPTTTPAAGKKRYQYTHTPPTTGRRKKPSPEEHRRERRYYLLFTAALLVIIAGFFVLAHFMDNYAYQKYLNEAHAFYEQGRYPDAWGKYHEALLVNDEGGEAYLGLARVSKIMRMREEQYLLLLNKAITFAPKGMHAMHYERAQYYLEKERYTSALTDLESVINIHPEFDTAHYHAGNIYLNYHRDYDKAIRAYNRAINSNPDYTEAIHNRGLCYLEQSNFEQAITDFSRVIELSPNMGRPYYYRARARLQIDDISNACLDLYKAQEFGLPDAYMVAETYCP